MMALEAEEAVVDLEVEEGVVVLVLVHLSLEILKLYNDIFRY